MRLTKNMLLIPMKDKQQQYALIHTVLIAFYIVTKEEAKIIKRWKTGDMICTESEEYGNLYETMKENGFLVEDEKEDETLMDQQKEICKRYHEKTCECTDKVTLVLTYKCNYTCPYCYENASLYKDNAVMTKEMVDRIFEIHNDSINYIAFYGGEPLLPDTRETIEYVFSKAPDAAYSAVTNGYYLEEYVRLFEKFKMNGIMVTLDGKEERHNMTRRLLDGGGTYQKVMKGIQMCLRQGVSIKIRMNISRNNVEECMELRNELIDSFSEAFSKKLLRFELQPLFQLPLNEKSELNKIILFSEESKGEKACQYNAIANTVSPVLKSFIRRGGASTPRYSYCDAEGGRRFYDAHGNVYSCILSLNRKQASVGTYYPTYHLKENSILNRSIETIPKCSRCRLKLLCGGGCANAIIDEKGDVMKPNCTQICHELFKDLPELFQEYNREKKYG